MEKYPELEEQFDASEAPSGDFLSREKDILGEDAANFDNGEIPASISDDEEAAEFQSNYPDLDATEPETAITNAEPVDVAASEPVTPVAAPADSQFLQEWKVKKELEIERLDKANEERQNETRQAAQKAIDSFYENYNAKRTQNLESVRKEADAFVAERDQTNSGSTWQRIASLIAEVPAPAEGINPANKTRFKELVTALENDPNAPGAAGY